MSLNKAFFKNIVTEFHIFSHNSGVVCDSLYEIGDNMTRITFILSAAMLTGLAACSTVPEPEPEPVIVTPPQPVLTCAPISSLQKVTVPAETKVQYYSTGIDNGEYGDIESARLKRTIVIKPAQVFYVNSEGREVLDICENVVTGDVGPGVGEIIEGG